MKGLDPEEYIDPSKSWRDNEKLVCGKLIRELVLDISAGRWLQSDTC